MHVQPVFSSTFPEKSHEAEGNQCQGQSWGPRLAEAFLAALWCRLCLGKGPSLGRKCGKCRGLASVKSAEVMKIEFLTVAKLVDVFQRVYPKISLCSHDACARPNAHDAPNKQRLTLFHVGQVDRQTLR